MGTRPVGRPRQRWQDDVLEDLKKLKVKNWKETAKDRRTWRDLAEKEKTHKGLYYQMMIMMMIITKTPTTLLTTVRGSKFGRGDKYFFSAKRPYRL
jgi:hypothetical protein